MCFYPVPFPPNHLRPNQFLVFAARRTTIAIVGASDSCRRDFNLVALICQRWNVLSTSGGCVKVYRFSTIFATDRCWFSCISMHCSWKRQLLFCESSLGTGSWIAPWVVFSNHFTVLTFCLCSKTPFVCWCGNRLRDTRFFARLRTTKIVCPFAENSFSYQALQLFRIHFPR